MRPRLTIASLLAVLHTCGIAGAQELPVEDGGVSLYQVEVVVFRHLSQRGSTEEAPPTAGAALTPPETGPAAVYGDPFPASPGDSPRPVLTPPDFQLAGIAARLRQSADYELIFHGGWVQPLESLQRTTPVPLPPEASIAGLRGSVSVYRERYLHAQVDLTIASGTGAATDATVVRLRQARRLRGMNPQYFDHPAFGVILSARPSGTAAGQLPDSAASTGEPPRNP